MNWVIRTFGLAVIHVIQAALKLPAPIILIGGAILSGLTMFLVQRIFLVRYVPDVIAGVMGLIILIIVLQKTKIDIPSLRYIVSILVILVHATLTLGAKHYASYLYFRYTFADLVHNSGHFDLAKYDADGYLLVSTGSAGIIGYIKHEIEVGVSVSDSNHVMVGVKNQDYINAQIGTLALIIAIEVIFGLFFENYNQQRKSQFGLT